MSFVTTSALRSGTHLDQRKLAEEGDPLEQVVHGLPVDPNGQRNGFGRLALDQVHDAGRGHGEVLGSGHRRRNDLLNDRFSVASEFAREIGSR